MDEFYPKSIEPVLLNWWLAFILRGSSECGIFDVIPTDLDNDNNVSYISLEDICNQWDIQKKYI